MKNLFNSRKGSGEKKILNYFKNRKSKGKIFLNIGNRMFPMTAVAKIGSRYYPMNIYRLSIYPSPITIGGIRYTKYDENILVEKDLAVVNLPKEDKEFVKSTARLRYAIRYISRLKPEDADMLEGTELDGITEFADEVAEEVSANIEHRRIMSALSGLGLNKEVSYMYVEDMAENV